MSNLQQKSKAPEKTASALGEKAEAISLAWSEAGLVYPLYFFLATHFHLEIPLTRNALLPPVCPATEEFEKITRWLEQMDTSVRTNQLRQLLHSVKDIKAESLRALILRLLRRPEKSTTDRDNIDLLLATYFALCAPEDLYSCEITLRDVADILRAVVVDADDTELEWCRPLDQILEATKQCHGLGDVFAARLLEKGRELKEAAGFMFYDPAALVAFTRFNFLLRRAFFRLLHSDLRAIREGLSELERRGIITVNCQSAGLTAQEPVSHLREISLKWRQPIPKDYAEEAANQTFEQLLAIRAAVERALGIVHANPNIPEIPSSMAPGFEAKAPPPATGARSPLAGPEAVPRSAAEPQGRAEASEPPAQGEKNTAQAKREPKDLSARPADRGPVSAPKADATPADAKASTAGAPAGAHAAPSGANGAPAPELEECLESIWEQLIEAPPARGRSMSIVKLGEARVLLSAWEVNAFVSEGGQLSEDLRRAVAARALVVLAREREKASGDRAGLNAAIALGRQEMGYLQERVEEAQRAKKTEAAVNLGISARRLLSAIEEVQQR